MLQDPDKQKSLDDFWDIENLLPQKKSAERISRQMSVEAVEIELDVPKKSALESVAVIEPQALPARSEERDGIVRTQKKTEPISPILTYTPRHPLLGEVRIYPWRSSFHFYERFCHIANTLFDRHGSPCEAVPFFSYMPQYDQMSRAQLDWYLYWRDCVRSGTYLDTDYSYIFLYLFEIINLMGRIPPKEGQRLMCDIWQQYRKVYPLLNRYLADWICDYSLIHQLPPPTDRIGDLLPLMAENSSFKEFYACSSDNEAHQEAHIYLTFCTNYNYKKSKLYLAGSAQAAAMDEHIPGAIAMVIRTLQDKNTAFSHTKMQKATLARDSFIGALCSGDMKRRIEVEYCSFNRSHELRFLITDMIKYTENRLRTVFGMKSRLSIYGLPTQIKEGLDSYLDQTLPSKRRLIVEERPAYEALYDAPATGVSTEHAREIEQLSWDMTRQLVEAFEEEAPTTADISIEFKCNSPVSHASEEDHPMSNYAELLRAIDQGSVAEQQKWCRAIGKMLDAVAEEINTLATDLWGDILLEENGNGYALIEDYRDEIASLLEE